MSVRTTPWTLLCVGVPVALGLACTRDPVENEDETTMMMMDSSGTTTATSTTNADSSTSPPDTSDTSGDPLPPDVGGPPSCVDDSCGTVDLLFVIDNSGSMGQQQLKLARSFQTLVDRLQALEDPQGNALNPNIRIMVTTTDYGHPLCTAFQKPDYTPAQGAPIYTGCNVRINRFTGLNPMMPQVVEEACTENCPVDVAPDGHFIEFGPQGSNVPDDDVGTALACIGPQGIDGCGYEAPLETMLQALNEGACWNDPSQPGCDEERPWASTTEGFLREDAALAIVLVTDELDCSVNPPGGYSFFTDIQNTVYWNVNPELGVPQATSAVCFNAGVTCDDMAGDGIYEGCTATDSEVLQPVSRYTTYLDQLGETREVMMLTLTGVPPVLAHNPQPPFEPTAGGVLDLVYRDWIDGPYPAGDILPEEWSLGTVNVDTKKFLFGDLGPGCFGADDSGMITNQAIPSVRMRQVCEHLDYNDPESGDDLVRCCMESICDDDYDPAFRCLTGMISDAIWRDQIVTD